MLNSNIAFGNCLTNKYQKWSVLPLNQLIKLHGKQT